MFRLMFLPLLVSTSCYARKYHSSSIVWLPNRTREAQTCQLMTGDGNAVRWSRGLITEGTAMKQGQATELSRMTFTRFFPTQQTHAWYGTHTFKQCREPTHETLPLKRPQGGKKKAIGRKPDGQGESGFPGF